MIYNAGTQIRINFILGQLVRYNLREHRRPSAADDCLESLESHLILSHDAVVKGAITISDIMASLLKLVGIRHFVVLIAISDLAAAGSICSNSSAAPYTLQQLATICDETFAVTNAVYRSKAVDRKSVV